MGIVDVFAICSMCFAIFAYCSYLCALQKKKETDFIIRLFQYKELGDEMAMLLLLLLLLCLLRVRGI